MSTASVTIMVDVGLRSITRDNDSFSSRPAFSTRAQSTESLSQAEHHLNHVEPSVDDETAAVTYPPSIAGSSLGGANFYNEETPGQAVSLAPMDKGRQAWWATWIILYLGNLAHFS